MNDKLRFIGCTYDELKQEMASYDYETKDYILSEHFPKEEQIVMACLWSGSYEGGAWIIWQDGGKLYEYRGSHCSCNSLSEDWEGESPAAEVTLEAIAMRHKAKDDYPFELKDACKEAKIPINVVWDALIEGYLLRY